MSSLGLKVNPFLKDVEACWAFLKDSQELLQKLTSLQNTKWCDPKLKCSANQLIIDIGVAIDRALEDLGRETICQKNWELYVRPAKEAEEREA